jgi:hypothetical protein
MSTNDTTDDPRRTALHTLDRLVGTWAMDGTGSRGTVRYSWFEGGDAFLVQEIDLVADGETTRGIEYIGWDPESETLRSHYFASSGEILEYTYDLTGDTLTIWFGGPDSPAKFVGTFDASGNHNTGGWQWPGGGYESNMTRIEEDAAR